jgi:hypothetical protein
MRTRFTGAAVVEMIEPQATGLVQSAGTSRVHRREEHVGIEDRRLAGPGTWALVGVPRLEDIRMQRCDFAGRTTRREINTGRVEPVDA